MKISQVKLTGFKSFVDPCELRIMPGLTGVVGPNGCGKSNLLEAIRWVMGEGSPKSMRGGAMDDVIFAGTASRPQRQFAEVSILAERSGENDGDEVEVVRRIERGAGSAYRINGRDARARDAQLIFADAATGAHSPALVSQGRIGAIISAKPAERRAMLEEAAGISGLHVRRREAEIRLKATEANLARVAEVIADQDARIAMLRRQARSAERYRNLSDDIRMAEGQLIYARWRDAASAAQLAEAEALAADAAVNFAAGAQRNAAARTAAAASALAAARTTSQTARNAAADVRHQCAAIDAERTAVDIQIAEIANKIDQLATDRARESELERDASDAVNRLCAEVTALLARAATAARERPGCVDAVQEAEQTSRDAELARAQALAQIAREAADRRVADAAITVATERLARAKAAVADVKLELAAATNVAAAKAACNAAADQRAAAQNAADRTSAALQIAEHVRTTAAETRMAAERRAAMMAAALAALETEAVALSRDVEAASGALSQVRAAPGYETALAAALADDLHAEIGSDGARRWAGATIAPTDPKLPIGGPLAAHVVAPDELARRLAQIAVVDVDNGVALAVGQRVVTRDGKLRRWDGFASNGAGAAAAERLKQRNRLAAIETERQQAATAEKSAARHLHDAELAMQSAQQDLDHSRRARDLADNALRSALRIEDQAELAFDRATATDLALRAKQAAADADAAAAVIARDHALTTVSALAPSTPDRTAHTLDQLATSARQSATQLRADLIARDGQAMADQARCTVARAEIEEWRLRNAKAATRFEAMAARETALERERARLGAAPTRLAQKSALLDAKTLHFSELARAALDAERTAETALRDCEAVAVATSDALADAREIRAGAQARAENQNLRRVEMGRVASERFECPTAMLPEKLAFDASCVGATIDQSARLERSVMERERLGPVNLVAESELAGLEVEQVTNVNDIAELTEAVHRLRGSIGRLNREGRVRLRASFDAVNGHFQTLFGTLFNGGVAHLALIDSEDPLDAGLEIMAQPPGKKLSSLTLLSGGEQALTAVALIFALFLTNPAPLCVLDEVDAPLDDANVERFCDLLDAMTRDTKTRYLIVTHNAVTMARMHRLYGVTMIEQGISRLVSVDLSAAESLLAAE